MVVGCLVAKWRADRAEGLIFDAEWGAGFRADFRAILGVPQFRAKFQERNPDHRDDSFFMGLHSQGIENGLITVGLIFGFILGLLAC